jgi:hypothetical protein
MTDLTFLDSHKPALPEGLYTVKATLGAKGTPRGTAAYPTPQAPFDESFPAAHDVVFKVGGPPSGLHESDVVSVYPPAGSQGDYGTVLPSIVLSNPTLPFARIVETVAGAPCLALLLLSDAELRVGGQMSSFGPADGDRPDMEQIILDTIFFAMSRRPPPTCTC